MAVSAAANAAQVTENYATSTNLTIANVIEQAKINQAFPKAEAWERAAMGRASPQELNSLSGLFKKGDKERAIEMATKMGFANINSQEDVQKLINISSEQVSGEYLGYSVNPTLAKSIEQKRKTGKGGYTREERAFRSAINVGVDMDAGFATIEDREAKQDKLKTAPGGMAAGGEKITASASDASSKLFAKGAEQITQAVGGMKEFGNIMKDMASKIDVDKYVQALNEAGSPFKVSSDTFEKSVKEFAGAISKLSGKNADAFGNPNNDTKQSTTPGTKSN
jgi:hypothetical protein